MLGQRGPSQGGPEIASQQEFGGEEEEIQAIRRGGVDGAMEAYSWI